MGEKQEYFPGKSAGKKMQGRWIVYVAMFWNPNAVVLHEKEREKAIWIKKQASMDLEKAENSVIL